MINIYELKSVLYYLSYFLNPKSKYLKVNKELKQIKKNNNAFILATGPSIKGQDLSKLKGKECYSVSNFFLHEDISIIKPKLHFFNGFHQPLVLENYIEWLKMADAKLPNETNIVITISEKSRIDENKIFKNRKVYYLDFAFRNKIVTDITKPITAPTTIPLMVLPVLDYLDYDEINLIGCDMNGVKDYGGNVKNFYSVDPRINATNGKTWDGGVMPSLEATLLSLKMFNNYNMYFQNKGKRLYNLSNDSWIDFVDYRDYDSYMEMLV